MMVKGYGGLRFICLCITDCWAASGHSVQGCLQLENQLRACMDAPVSCSLLRFFYSLLVRWSEYIGIGHR